MNEMEAYQVVVIGAGPAGLSAAMYFAKADMPTLVIGDGRTLMKSAYLDHTYLGITEEMTGEDFLKLAADQVQRMGATLLESKVTDIREEGEGYAVVTSEGTYLAEYLVLASGVQFETPALAGVELEENDEPYIKQRIKVDARGRTNKRNVYAAGVSAGVSSQAIVAAGIGAQVALNLLSDLSGQRICIHDKKPVVAK
jgi:thioredoxin reductase (NADPH)